MSLVWERAPYTAGSLLVLLALADWSNDEGVSWPSIPRIASKTRLERRSIQYIIRTLKKDGLLDIEEGRGRGHQHRYTINVQNLRLLPSLMVDETESKNVQSVAPITEIKGEIHNTEKAQFDAQKAQSATEKVQPIAPDPLVDPLDQPSGDPSVNGQPFSSEVFLTSLKDFEQHRKEIRKPLTPMARKKLFRQLEQMGEQRAIAALDYSVAHGWIGVFEARESGNGSYSRPSASERNVSNIKGSLEYLNSLNDEKLLN